MERVKARSRSQQSGTFLINLMSRSCSNCMIYDLHRNTSTVWISKTVLVARLEEVDRHHGQKATEIVGNVYVS